MDHLHILVLQFKNVQVCYEEKRTSLLTPYLVESGSSVLIDPQALLVQNPGQSQTLIRNQTSCPLRKRLTKQCLCPVLQYGKNQQRVSTR